MYVSKFPARTLNSKLTAFLLGKLEETGAKILEMDFLDESTIEHAAREYGDQPLDVLVNVGGLPPNPKAWQENTPSLLSERFSVWALSW
ncbi:uncharacterized protein N7483_009258 [Penicillium malachiteum]|uniref:uncharacterized protein n=1 Tax=Penicillium malachiteum TaxID=1324776 RepID=UPI0025492A1A|nr:uncharacterized protein N7483_009258 [Penicillium malachiteum]KAJ5721324.1 hypothetical protein N7483_009258 [Penicillium malachiteum]